MIIFCIYVLLFQLNFVVVPIQIKPNKPFLHIIAFRSLFVTERYANYTFSERKMKGLAHCISISGESLKKNGVTCTRKQVIKLTYFLYSTLRSRSPTHFFFRGWVYSQYYLHSFPLKKIYGY